MKKTFILTLSFMFVFTAMLLLPNLAFASETEGSTSEITEEGELDTEAPVIYGVSEYTISNKSKISIDTLKDSLTIIDNVDSDIEPLLFDDYYSENWKTPGTYYITFKAKDTAGNYGSFIVKINVIDTTAPVFTTKDGLPISSYTVHKSPDSVFILTEVMESVVVTDDIDGVISSFQTIEDTYTGKGDKNGTYKIIVAARDNSGNQSTFIININVTSSIPNKTIVLDRKNVIVENNVKLTNEDFSNVLKVCGYYNSNTTTYINVDDALYQELSGTVGDYLVGYELTTTSGTKTTGSLNVKVVESRTGDNTIVNESDNFVIKLFKWIWKILQKIIEFFSRIFK